MEDLQEVARLILLQVDHNRECGKDDKFTKDEIADIINRRVFKKLNEPAVINNEAEASSEGVAVCCDTCKYVNGFRCNHVQGCESNGNYELWEQKTGL